MKRTFNTTLGLVAALSILSTPAVSQDSADTTMTKSKAQPKLEDFIGEVKLPELYIGSKAPELQIAKFVKGDSVSGFEPGQVYVVEFWATWCGPCIAAFPHLSELQKEHGDDVKFIGVNVWENVEDQTERIDKVESFVADQGARMSYTVAVENGSAMADTWMRPAGQNGIPAAFIVDGTGKIAWIGHPASIEEPLAQVVSGKLDTKKAIETARHESMMMAGYQKFAQDLQSGNVDEARQIGDILVNQYVSDEPAALNAIAWMLLTTDNPKIGPAEYKLAHKAIAIACEKTGWKDWSLLDTYALAAFKNGSPEEAVKWEKKAIKLAPAEDKNTIKELEARLEQFAEEG